MEKKIGKHVKLICDLKKGDKVYTEGWGYQLDGKELIVEDVKEAMGRCQSGFLVKVTNYENYIDSDWVNKKPQLALDIN